MFNEMMVAGSGGGGSAEWITIPDSTTSPYTISTQWNYDADTIIVAVTLGGNQLILMYDIATNDMWYCVSRDVVWTHYGVDGRFTFTSRSLTGSFNTSATNISVIPIVGKPTGYFT